MKFNVGTIDRVVRMAVGIILIGVAVTGTVSGVWVWVTGIVGAVLAITGLFKFCPAYAVFGLSTCPTKKA